MAQERIPSLDGLRAAAISMVMICHSGVALGTHYGFTAPQPVLAFGELGVTIFFVISGYLITTLLLQEMEKRGTISLPSFYFRRTFRLLPAYYALIAFVSVGYLIGAVKTSHWTEILLHALTYTTNYNTNFFWYLGHSWSLSVEEQFYLLWPALLLALGKKHGLRCLALPLIICPIVRAYYASTSDVWNRNFRFEAVADSLSAGCLLGGCREWMQAGATYRLFLRRWTVLIAPAWLALICLFPLAETLFHLGHTATIAAIAVCIDWSITFPDAMIGRILNAKASVYVGTLSYSLYLWQQPFLNPYTHSRISEFPLNLGCAAVAALFSYYCIERPGLALRDKAGGKLFVARPVHVNPRASA